MIKATLKSLSKQILKTFADLLAIVRSRSKISNSLNLHTISKYNVLQLRKHQLIRDWLNKVINE